MSMALLPMKPRMGLNIPVYFLMFVVISGSLKSWAANSLSISGPSISATSTSSVKRIWLNRKVV